MVKKENKPPLVVPTFHSEEAEAKWWEQVKFSEHQILPLSEQGQQRKRPPAKRNKTHTPVSIPFQAEQIQAIKQLAQEQKINYQVLIKLWVAERLDVEKHR